MEYFNTILSLDSNAKVKSYKKGDILQHSGETNINSYFVKSGLIRSYTIDEKGKEHIFMFAAEGWVTADIESQEFQHPTELFIDCLENSEIIAFNRKSFRISNLTPDQLKEKAHLMARRIAVLQRRVIMLMSASAQNRYEHFLEMYPLLINRVPQRMIASYLGITPQSLSTIRAKMVHKK